MSCEELRDSFELYALGLLDGEEKIEMDAHLTRGCQTCRKALNDALAVNALLLSLPPSVAPPARLKRRLLASVGFQRPRWGWVPALAAVMLLVVAVWLGFEERQREGELA